MNVKKGVKLVSQAAVPAVRLSPLAYNHRRRFSILAERAQTKDATLTVNSYMRQIYINSFLGFGGTLMAAEILSANAMFLTGGSFALGAISSLAGVIGFSFTRAEHRRVTDVEGREKMVAIDTVARKAFLGLFAGGSALALAPLLAMANAMSTTLVPYSIVLTASTFLGMSAYAMTRPAGSFSTWGSVLSGALVSMLALQVAGGCAYLAIGANAFSSSLMTVQPYAALGLFSAFQAYDTHAALQEYEEGHVDVLGHSFNFLLNLKNIFTSILQILMRFRND